MISVIYLNYNRCADLDRSLSKIFLQTDVEFEVLVVDQNSQDGSQQMIKSKYPLVQLFELKENLGVAGGRNYGAKMAKGDYLVFIDDDAEFVETSALKKTELVFQNNPFINIIGYNINGHPEKPERNLFFSTKKDCFTNYFIGCGHAIRKEIFYKLGGYSGNLFFWGEEIEFAIKTFSIPKNKILFKGDIVLFHRVSPVQRLKWKEGRLYYKVRNRFALTRNLLPFPVYFISLGYYYTAYLLRAIQLNDIKSYYRGVRDSRTLIIEKDQRLNLRQWISYTFN
jgi:GT2 family glycosyltransferase